MSESGATGRAFPHAIASANALPFSVRLRRELLGASLAREPVKGRDLVDALAELWCDAHLRRGYTRVGLGEVRAQVRPVFRDAADAGRTCAGLELATRDPDGQAVRRTFPLECLAPVAARCAQRLVDAGVLERGSAYFYDLVASERALPSQAPADGGAPLEGPPGRGAPELRAGVPLRRLLARATRCGAEVDGDHYPVFFSRAALERAARISRKGTSAEPPIETGGLLVGPLCACPETGELFALVTDVIEASGSECTTYSLTYAGPTWARIQTILRARQADAATRAHRILGQCHGHNFPPTGGAAPCEVCHLLPVCTRTSATLSSDDRVWCRAVFAGEPWQLSQVFGLDARGREVESFYGQRGGELVPRGYFVVDDVDDLLAWRGE